LLRRFLPYQLNKIAKRVSDECSVIYSNEFQLSISQWRIVARLGEVDQLQAKDLVSQTLMDKSKVSRVVRQLQQRKLLIRQRDKSDLRAWRLALTPEGRMLYSAIVPRALAWEASLLRALDAAEYRDLLRIMEKLDQRLDRMTAADSSA
jgi:DNA-binding MarR family transcriptional regulator